MSSDFEDENEGQERGRVNPRGSRRFDRQKLDVYRQSLKFVDWMRPLNAEVRENSGKPVTEVCNHLDCAGLSILFNAAEGSGQCPWQTRAKFFGEACGSAAECVTCLDMLVARAACEQPRIKPGKDMLLRIVSMLTELMTRFEQTDNFHEGASDYQADDALA